MTSTVLLPAGPGGRLVLVVDGPGLLRGTLPLESLVPHRRIWPAPTTWPAVDPLIRMLTRARIRGRGGAAFPFARKVQSAADAGNTASVVVNGAESEPGSAKDAALLLAVPHLVLDGAELVARALGARRVNVVVPGGRPGVEAAVTRALAQREGSMSWTITATSGGFVGGHSSAVLELLAGRPNRPATRFGPATAGSRRRPGRLLSNVETFAQTAAAHLMGPQQYLGHGTADEPGTTLLSIGGDGIVDLGTAHVVEVDHGVALAEVLARTDATRDTAVLVGGYHGVWVPAAAVHTVMVSRASTAGTGSVLGPGVILPLPRGRCPLDVTGQILTYLADQRARQCGPCDAGMPRLASAVTSLSTGTSPAERHAADAATETIVGLAKLINGRGACAHPDGAARLSYSMISAFGDEIEAHRRGGCSIGQG